MNAMNLVAKRRTILLIAAVLSVLSLGLVIGVGLNFGIDFLGGTLMERGLPANVTAEDVRAVLTGPALDQYNLGGSAVQPLEELATGERVMLIRTHAFDDSSITTRIDEALEVAFGEVEVRRTELVGPVIGQELVRNALWALLLSAVGMGIYLSFRFEYRFGVSAIAAILFNVVITLAVVALLRIEINTPFVAAILTVVGYSINDTIVIFDRIRENLTLRRNESVEQVVNKSVIQSLTRSLNTSATTLVVLVALYFLGGSTLKGFTLILITGVIVGALSSIFIASPLWLVWREMDDRRMKKAG